VADDLHMPTERMRAAIDAAVGRFTHNDTATAEIVDAVMHNLLQGNALIDVTRAALQRHGQHGAAAKLVELVELQRYTSRSLLDSAVTSALHTPDQWAPHVWSQLAAAAVAVERAEREAELHPLVVAAQRAFSSPPPAQPVVVQATERGDVMGRPCPWPTCGHPVHDHYGDDAAAQFGDPSRLGCSITGCRCTLSAEQVLSARQFNAQPVSIGGRGVTYVYPAGRDDAPEWLIALVDAAATGDMVRSADLAGAPRWIVEIITGTREVMTENEQHNTMAACTCPQPIGRNPECPVHGNDACTCTAVEADGEREHDDLNGLCPRNGR
jgi:hypothetical protein